MEISTFNNTEFGEIRTIQKNGEVLFCGKDIAAALGYADPKKAIIQHCKENHQYKISHQRHEAKAYSVCYQSVPDIQTL